MMHCVTLTGADDSVDPKQLVEVWDEFDFVEWGILVGSRSGTPRMPSDDWIRRLADCFLKSASDCDMRLSLHICGKHLRAILKGQQPFADQPDFPHHIFDRWQLNFHAEPITTEQADNVAKVLMEGPALDIVPIIQLDGVNDHVMSLCRDRGISGRRRVDGLFDQSHGAGVLPHNWNAPIPGFMCGYAGGLGPDNIETELPKISNAAAGSRFWIDMETKLYSNGGAQFDLAKCRAVLGVCESWFSGPMG
jgi:hypothetical protein